jgi:ankyrin repeat protein
MSGMEESPQLRTDDGEQLTAAQLAFLASMFDVVREGESAQLTSLLDRGLPVNLTNGKGDTLLILAAYHKHGDLVRVLLERGADTARVNDRGQTALAAAVFRDTPRIVTDLLDAGADPELGEPNALAVAGFFELPKMAALLAARR